MTAWAILGLEAGADEREIKRAYARLLKQHRPDADPEGFRRIRDAYEALLRSPRSTISLITSPLPMPIAVGDVVVRVVEPVVTTEASVAAIGGARAWDVAVAGLKSACAETVRGLRRDEEIVAAVQALTALLGSHPGAAPAWAAALRHHLSDEPRLIDRALTDQDLITAHALGAQDLIGMAIAVRSERRDWPRLCALARAWRLRMDADDPSQAVVAGLLANRIAIIDYPLAAAIAGDLRLGPGTAGSDLDYSLMLGHEVADWPENCRRQVMLILTDGLKARKEAAVYAQVQIHARALLARNPGSAMVRLLHTHAKDYFPRAISNERHIRFTVLGFIVCVLTFLGLSLGINLTVLLTTWIPSLGWALIPGCIITSLGAIYGGRKLYVKIEPWFYRTAWPRIDRWLGPIDGAWWWTNVWVQAVMMPMLITNDVIPATLWAWLPGIPAGIAMSRLLHEVLGRRAGSGWRRFLPQWNLLLLDAGLRLSTSQATVTNLGWFVPGVATCASVIICTAFAIHALRYPDYQWAWAISPPLFLMLWCACHGWFSGWATKRPLRWTLMWWWMAAGLLLAPASAWAGGRIGMMWTRSDEGRVVATCILGSLLIAALVAIAGASVISRWRYGPAVIPR